MSKNSEIAWIKSADGVAIEIGIQSSLSSDWNVSGFIGFSSALIESKHLANDYVIPDIIPKLASFLHIAHKILRFGILIKS